MNFATEYSISFLHTTTNDLEFKLKMLLTFTAYLHVKLLIFLTFCVAFQNYHHVNLVSMHLAHSTRKCSLILAPKGLIRLHFFFYNTVTLTCILYSYLNVGTVFLFRCSSVTCGYGRPCHSPTNMSYESCIAVKLRLLRTKIQRHAAHAHVCEVHNAILWIFNNTRLAQIYCVWIMFLCRKNCTSRENLLNSVGLLCFFINNYYAWFCGAMDGALNRLFNCLFSCMVGRYCGFPHVTISLRTFVLLYIVQTYQLAKPQLVYNCEYIRSPICYVTAHNKFIYFVFIYKVVFDF